jgi:hypothetical protein
MPKFSAAFHLVRSQPELDFVDVSLNTDNQLFVDPFPLSQKADRWSQEAHLTVVTFFQSIIDSIRQGKPRAKPPTCIAMLAPSIFELAKASESRMILCRRLGRGASHRSNLGRQLYAVVSIGITRTRCCLIETQHLLARPSERLDPDSKRLCGKPVNSSLARLWEDDVSFF